jgi:hypothetical protein
MWRSRRCIDLFLVGCIRKREEPKRLSPMFHAISGISGSTRMDWTARLSKPVMLDDGAALRTLSDAREFILALPEQHRGLETWKEWPVFCLSQRNSNEPTSPPSPLWNCGKRCGHRRRCPSPLRKREARSKKPPAPSARRRSKEQQRRAGRIK